MREFRMGKSSLHQPIHFAYGESSFDPFKQVDIGLASIDSSRYRSYSGAMGLESLREAVCRHYRKEFGYTLAPERVCITNGASEALQIALAMFISPGDEVILPASYYPAYLPLALICNAQCTFAPLNEKQCLDVEQVSAVISPKTKAMIVNSPSNPHGAVLSQAELTAVAALGIPVIFDEVYQALSLTDTPIPSAITLSDQHIVVNSFSKSVAAAGLRIGYMIVPESQIEQVHNIKIILNVCTNRLNQIIAERLLDHWPVLVSAHRTMLCKNWQLFRQVANDLGLTLRSDPQAGFFATIDVSATKESSKDVAMDLARQYALSTVPGIDFQRTDNQFLRLSFAGATDEIEIGLKRLQSYLNGRRS